MTKRNHTTRTLAVYADNEYGFFNVVEFEPQTRSSDNYTNYAVLWTCYSSYGVYGHWWDSMGEPFVDFVQHVERYYLLGKISNTAYDEFRYRDAVMAKLKWLKDDDRITGVDYDKCKSHIRLLFDRYDGDKNGTLAIKIGDSSRLQRLAEPITAVDCNFFPQQAEAFVDNIWPHFVEALKDPNCKEVQKWIKRQPPEPSTTTPSSTA